MCLLIIVTSFGCRTTKFTNDQFNYKIGNNKKGEVVLVIELPYDKTSKVGLGIFTAEFTRPRKRVGSLAIHDNESNLLWQIEQYKSNNDLLAIRYGTVPAHYRQTYPEDQLKPVLLQQNKKYMVKIQTESGQEETNIIMPL